MFCVAGWLAAESIIDCAAGVEVNMMEFGLDEKESWQLVITGSR